MDFFSVVKKRCSVRKYNDKPIKFEDIEKIIDAARRAPTARGEEPWEFIVVKEKDSLKDLAGFADHGRFIKEAGCCIVVICRDTKYYLEDGCAATENILLAATALGIGSCWVAGDKKHYAGKILRYLKVPDGYKLISLVALGYPGKEINVHRKRPLNDVLHKERF